MNHEQRLKLVSQAWGRKLEDTFYCFFPYIDRDEQAKAGTRRAGYHEGPAFEWPTDRDKIVVHMAEHENHDLYWCPSLFEYPERKTEYAVDEKALWADLDEVDPRTLDEYPPTVAWETSPGRFQALWLLNQGDLRGASWEGGENQRLTYYIGADESGWDTTQLLRVPEWTNHKLNYRKKGKQAPKGKVLWGQGRRYLPDDFDELPEVETTGGMVTDVIVDEVDRINIAEVKARVRLKLTRRIRDYLGARETSGDRSDVLWEIETSLAEAGCTVTEIVAIVRSTVWNKYEGRADEMKRLLTEATKAASKISRKKDDEQEERDIAREDADTVKVRPLSAWIDNVKEPEWLVKGILSEGAVGFIAGEPKSFKSWFGLDLALSVASGARFLNYFDVPRAHPVLYLQEEDPPHTIKKRQRRIVKDKKTPLVLMGEVDENGRPTVDFHPPAPVTDDAPIGAVLQGGLILSEDVWQEWLDEVLAERYLGDPYGLVLIDTLMMVAGDVEENRSQQMTTKIFKPMKQIARKHNTALFFIHHMRKGGTDSTKRGGQRLLGSVANHAWAEDSMYLSLTTTRRIELEVESKNFESKDYVIDGVGTGTGWRPQVSYRGGEQASLSSSEADELRDDTSTRNKLLAAALGNLGGRATAPKLVSATGYNSARVRRGLQHLEKLGRVRRLGRSDWLLVK